MTQAGYRASAATTATATFRAGDWSAGAGGPAGWGAPGALDMFSDGAQGLMAEDSSVSQASTHTLHTPLIHPSDTLHTPFLQPYCTLDTPLIHPYC